MRILLHASHQYPAGGRAGTGLAPNPRATGGSSLVHDWLAKGLAEIGGHEVFYLLDDGADEKLPEGVELVHGPLPNVDIIHHFNSQWIAQSQIVAAARERGQPWVTTCHSDPAGWLNRNGPVGGNWIFVSKTLARCCGQARYVRNGIDPSEYIYSESKDDYLLFVCNLRSLRDKGLDVSLALSRELGFELVVAGTSVATEPIRVCAEMCREYGARFVGDVRGTAKAELFAGARALLFPTKLNEACGLVMLEALMSGTPVISSDRGAVAEIVSPDVGFICPDAQGLRRAVERIGEISPRACREKALREFTHIRMAADYVHEYQREIEVLTAPTARTNHQRTQSSDGP